MALTYVQITTLTNQISAFAADLQALKDQITRLKASGTIVYQNADLLTQWPTDGATLRTMLVTLGNNLNTFLAAMPNFQYPNS